MTDGPSRAEPNFQSSPIFSGALQQTNTFVGDFLIELEQISEHNLLCSIGSPEL